ncbi:hypothetical protein [Neisseria lactamica]|uniref:hypothetical protein n=1 Tax=Neisseria lactamica TaxID=486 RepID=UPI000E59809D|nr:hypothetical protein [Neisseria lactamica]
MKQEPQIKINPDDTLTVTLSDGTAYVLREPLAKDMAGLGQDLIKIKHTETVQKILAKISTPKIGMAQYGVLNMADTQALNAAIDFFSAPPSARTEIQEAFEALGYTENADTPPTPSPAS